LPSGLERWLNLRRRLETLWGRAYSSVLRLTPSENQRLLVLTIVSGALCGVAAVAFHSGIGKAEAALIGRALDAPGLSWILPVILTPALGGLLVGLALHYWVPGAVGSGVPQVKAAFALGGGRIPLRDAIGKFVLGIIQIGTGASLGREGPTVQICGGISNGLGRLFWLSVPNQRRMTSVGVAAGIAAAFNAPIAAVTFTLEEVIGDLDQTILSGVIVAAAVAAAVERSILGQHPVFDIQRPYTLGPVSSRLPPELAGAVQAVHENAKVGASGGRRRTDGHFGGDRSAVAGAERDCRWRISDPGPGAHCIPAAPGDVGAGPAEASGHCLLLQ
jgi:chloride channel protein, CIC family